MSHTPGPWVLQGFRIYGPKDARSKHRNGRALLGGVVDDGSDWRAAPLDPGGCGAFYEESMANGHLMSSAPDLLAACKAAIEEFRQFMPTTAGTTLTMCEAAVAVAEGGEP